MANESVWTEQVDTALVKMVRDMIKLEDEHGQLISLPVSIRKPDEDFKIEKYPSITLYCHNIQGDVVRYDPTPVIVSKDIENLTAQVEDSALPYTLYYQIDFWSKLSTHMNSMLELWLSSYWRGHNLQVVDVAGNLRTCSMYTRHHLVKSDTLTDKNRIFHTIDGFNVWVELDPRVQRIEPIVREIIPISQRLGGN